MAFSLPSTAASAKCTVSPCEWEEEGAMSFVCMRFLISNCVHIKSFLLLPPLFVRFSSASGIIKLSGKLADQSFRSDFPGLGFRGFFIG